MKWKAYSWIAWKSEKCWPICHESRNNRQKKRIWGLFSYHLSRVHCVFEFLKLNVYGPSSLYPTTLVVSIFHCQQIKPAILISLNRWHVPHGPPHVLLSLPPISMKQSKEFFVLIWSTKILVWMVLKLSIPQHLIFFFWM